MKCKKSWKVKEKSRSAPRVHSGGKRPLRTLFLLITALLPLAVGVAWPTLPARATPEPTLLETTVFLGEAVPLHLGGERLEDILAGHLEEEDQMECWWVSPQGPASLDKLGKERPTRETDYSLTAVFHQEDGPDVLMNFIYRVRVEPGTIRIVAASGETSPQASALFKLEGRGLTLYRCAQPIQQPAGNITLEVEFTGLPFGAYQVTAEDPGLYPRERECLVGVCRENDTVSTRRGTAEAAFTIEQDPGGAVWESYQLGAAP